MTRALILAAGLGTRMRPLSDFCAKPALPVRGIPLIAVLLELLKRHAVREVMVNLHHHPKSIRKAIREFKPGGIEVCFSDETKPLGTGGGIRKAREFLLGQDPALVLAGDMLLDINLTALVSLHQKRGDLATLVLKEDSRMDRFGSIGIAKGGAVRRIAESFDLGQEHQAGIFTGVRIFSQAALESLPERDCFEDLRDWLVPLLERGSSGIRGELLTRERCSWEPVGTPAEYLRANLSPKTLAYTDGDARARGRGVRFGEGGEQLVIGARAKLGNHTKLTRCVIWDDEIVPDGTTAHDGVFAKGRFISCEEPG